jgi:hypothetical protein
MSPENREALKQKHRAIGNSARTMRMPLKLKQPPPDDVADVVPAEQELTQRAIDRLHAKIESYIDQLVAAERERMPNLPAVALRALLMRKDCLCGVARRLLEQQT